MKRLFVSLGLLLSLIFGFILTPFNYVYADSGQILESKIKITDYYRYKLNTSYTGPIMKPIVSGNVIYYFNMPIDLSNEETVSKVEVNYKVCVSWWLGLKWTWCIKKEERSGVILDYENDLVYNVSDGYNPTFPHEENIIKEVGETSSLIAKSNELGVVAIYTDLVNTGYGSMATTKSYFLAYDTFTTGVSSISTYNNLTKYKYYFAFSEDYSWDDLVIKASVINLNTGQEQEYICGDNGEGCYLGGDPIPPTTPDILNKIEQFIDWINSILASNTLGYVIVGILVFFALWVINQLFGILRTLTAIPGFIGHVIRFSIKSIKFIIIAIKKTVIFTWNVIKWIVTRIWLTIGFIIRIIVTIYSKISEIFHKRSSGKVFRDG